MADKRNATASWSGYLHQGQAGILVALKEMNRLIVANEMFDDWSVVFENAEDFDIQNGMGVFSRHQVKAYKDAKYPNAVKDVLGTQLYIDNKLITKGFQFRKLEGGVLTEVEVNEDSRYLHVITEIKGFVLNEDDFKKAYPDANWINNIHKIKLYEYSAGIFYCPLVTEGNSTLENYCLEEIQKYLVHIGHREAQEKEYKRRIYYCLVNQLDVEIKKRHIDKVDTYPKLLFSDIDQLLKSNPDQKAYLISACKKVLATIVNDFISDIYEQSGGLDVTVIERIQVHSSEIYHLDNEGFVQFLRDINPNEQDVGEFTSIHDVIALVKKDNFRTVFLNCLYQVSGSEYHLTDRGYQENGGYILSLIVDDYLSIKSLKRKISENSMLTQALFDKSYLINKEISDPENITKNDLSESINWGNNTDTSDRFDKSHMRLINVNDAINKLN
ncbi:ABC-three component system protein [Colwellia ponticola]|uniref:ABC-three component systems C-terminal domain-containing protein n=1 Tax=Colwellia ponticola TaxID=2304625 RepID=A0A8H2PLE2_9GAMM|nr:ABC-three component system protein [Colwellia ponticola]TMM41434.1 hypothetical protein FCS21_15550 [Colwellia ponticola]